jgi:RNA polymerase sigma factor (sigma-70 family)
MVTVSLLIDWSVRRREHRDRPLIQISRTICVMSPADVADLVRTAARGDDQAWDALVETYGGLVWAVARDHGLDPADSADVSQTTWLRLAEHLGRLDDPARVGLWLATTARNESLRALRGRRRLVPVDSVDLLEEPADGQDLDHRLIEEELDGSVRRAFEYLSPPCKVLLRTLLAEPAPSYAEVSIALGLPVGSIGPNRLRCLERLRRRLRAVESTPLLREATG